MTLNPKPSRCTDDPTDLEVRARWPLGVAHIPAVPYTLNLQPSTLNPQPSTLNPQSSTLNPQPSTLNPQPSTLAV